MKLFGHNSAAGQDVSDRLHEQRWIFPEVADPMVTSVAEKGSDLPCPVVMIDMQARSSVIVAIRGRSTNRAAAILFAVKSLELFNRNAVRPAKLIGFVGSAVRRHGIPFHCVHACQGFLGAHSRWATKVFDRTLLALSPVLLHLGPTEQGTAKLTWSQDPAPRPQSFPALPVGGPVSSSILEPCAAIFQRARLARVLDKVLSSIAFRKLDRLFSLLAARAYALTFPQFRELDAFVTEVTMKVSPRNEFVAPATISRLASRVHQASCFLGRLGHLAACSLRSLVPNSFLHQPHGVITAGRPRFAFLAVFCVIKALYGIIEFVSISFRPKEVTVWLSP